MEHLTPPSAEEQRLLRQTLGLRCRKARQALGLSQARLAAAMGRSASWVREIERGDQYAPPYLLLALARSTGKAPGWFYGQDERPRLEVEAVAEHLATHLRRALAAGADGVGG